MYRLKTLLLSLFLTSLLVSCANNEQPLPDTTNNFGDKKGLPNNCTGGYEPLKVLSTPYSSSSQKAQAEKALDSKDVSIFLKDGNKNYFDTHDWYHYTDAPDHTIWSFFDIFAVQTPDSQLYRMQFLSYYDLQNPTLSGAGVIALRIQPQNGPVTEVSVDARGCGNPFVEPDEVQKCLDDPNRRTRIYISLKDLCFKKMTEAQAQNDTQWNMALDRTDVYLNHGENITESTLAGLIYRDESLNSVKGSDVDPIKKKLDDMFAATEFSQYRIPENLSLQSPTFIKNMIDEKDWVSVDEDQLTAKPENWWLIRSADTNDIFQFNIPSFNKSSSDLTEMTLSFSRYDSKNSTKEPLNNLVIEFNPFKGKTDICIDFDTQQVVHCRKDKKLWELRFKNRPKGGEPRWSITTKAGSQGPLAIEDF